MQVTNYVSIKVNYYFSDSDVTKGNTLAELQSNYDDFLGKISIDDWYIKRNYEIDQMIASKDYNKILVAFNNKGIISIASKHLKISDFTNRSIKLLSTSDESRLLLSKYFPDEIKAAGNTVLPSP